MTVALVGGRSVLYVMKQPLFCFSSLKSASTCLCPEELKFLATITTTTIYIAKILIESQKFSSIQFLDRLASRGDITDYLEELFFQCFLQESTVNSSGMGRDVNSLTLSIQYLPLLTTVSPTLQGALTNGFGEVVVKCSMACSWLESCTFLSLDSCQKRFLWTHKKVGLAPQFWVRSKKHHAKRAFKIFTQFYTFWGQLAGLLGIPFKFPSVRLLHPIVTESRAIKRCVRQLQVVW